MIEIGATLREARTRARIDIAEIETATKIRAKYLRALENEEWDQLPGPTFVKTFLRTYAEALGLDARALVDEYKERHERLADLELRPISPRPQGSSGRGNRGPRRHPNGSLRAGGGERRSPRGPITVALVALVVAILAVIGYTKNGDGDGDKAGVGARSTPPAPAKAAGSTPASSAATPAPPVAKRPKRRLATLRIEPTGDVSVCLRARGQGTLIDGALLIAGRNSPTYRSRRFTLVLGNNNARLRINGKAFRPPAASRPIGYLITPNQRRRLPATQQRSCN